MSANFARRLLPFLLVGGVVGGVVGWPAGGAGAADPGPGPVAEATTAVIVELTDPGPHVGRRLAMDGVEVTAAVDRLGVAAADVTAQGRAALERSPHVRAVRPPRRFSMLLDTSAPIIEVPALHSSGRTGTGRVVAVIDSGVAVDHPGLVGSVVAEACFLHGVPVTEDDQAVELCGNTANASDPSAVELIGEGAAVPCQSLPESCTHGTHIAGVISGDDDTFTGVAPEAGIFAIRVGAVLESGPHIPELGVLRALEHIYERRDHHDLVAVNLSFGGPPDGCVDAAWEDVIGRLTEAGIAVVAAAGNDGLDTEITFPACLPEVISVAASTDSGELADFSQSGPLLDLVAPGTDVISTVLDSVAPSGFAAAAGTSFAAPHVSGAFALLDGLHPNFTLARMRSLMRATGQFLTRPTDADGDRDPRYPELRLGPILAFEPFSDADVGFWVAAADWARHTGVSTGPGGGVFDPEATLTRAQAVTFLWRFMGEPVAAGPNGFTDVPRDTWFTAAVDWAAETGVTTGLSPGIFGPEEPVPRAQVATFLWRTAGEPTAAVPSGFTDVVAGSFYDEAVDWMAEHALTTGTAPSTYSPEQIVTRAQMVTFTHRLAGASSAWGGAVEPPPLALF